MLVFFFLSRWQVRDVARVLNPWLPEGQDSVFYWGSMSKLYVFSMVEYDRIVFLDADILVRANVDELFSCDGFCSEVEDAIRWPAHFAFNAGMFSFKPSRRLFHDLFNHLHLGSYDQADQGFLNSYFFWWCLQGVPIQPVYSSAANLPVGTPAFDFSVCLNS